jgi:hypothetical protein
MLLLVRSCHSNCPCSCCCEAVVLHDAVIAGRATVMRCSVRCASFGHAPGGMSCSDGAFVCGVRQLQSASVRACDCDALLQQREIGADARRTVSGNAAGSYARSWSADCRRALDQKEPDATVQSAAASICQLLTVRQADGGQSAKDLCTMTATKNTL